jgi:hypothetical protein
LKVFEYDLKRHLLHYSKKLSQSSIRV